MKFYPLQFQPILKERIWGGTKLKSFLNKPITSPFTGESWELSAVPDNVSVITNGAFAGKPLNEVIEDFPEALLGTKVVQQFGTQFPLLFKYLDAKEDLSIQVHPNDALAKKRHNSFGKTEMWYVMQADADAKLIVGSKEKTSPEEYETRLKNNTIIDILDLKKVKKGDVFFLATGTIHAIGAGIVIAEIQQTSDITYRIYDFDRIDSSGNKRELHLDLALEAINYNKVEAQKQYSTLENSANRIVDCPYFTTNFIPLHGKMSIVKTKESFSVYMCVEGNFELHCNDTTYYYAIGDTILIPGAMTEFILQGKACLLEIYIS
jgi:mannose-6-phosphate isomerase